MADHPFLLGFFGFLSQARDDLATATALGSESFKFLSFASNFASLSRAQLLQDLWVLYESGMKRGGYFVEFGAADGALLSNTFTLEKYFGWSGALCEPNPVWHEQLCKNRNAFISRCCIAGHGGGVVKFNHAPVPEFSTIDSYSDADMHAARREGGHIDEIETLSLEDFLAAAAAPARIDYLSIDTEGSEWEILSAFDFSKFDIGLITVEHNFTEKREPIFDLLTRAGYRRKFEQFSQWDDWYVREPRPAVTGSR